MDLDFLLGLDFKLLGSAPSQTLFKDKDTQQPGPGLRASHPSLSRAWRTHTSLAALPLDSMGGEGSGGARSGRARSTFSLRCPGTQRWKPGTQPQLSPRTALPTPMEDSQSLSWPNSLLSEVRKARPVEAMCSRSHSKLQVGLILELRLLAYAVEAAVGHLLPRATCNPLFLLSESRMIPGAEALGPGTGWRELC